MSTYKNLRTPIIKPRTQGGTFYTFASALEDIGLNINELRNKVSISHYALLDIPSFDNNFVTLSTSSFSDVNVGDYKFAEGFENYVLNMETVVRNQETYNFSESKTVSEKIFWKWLQKSCMNLQPDASNNNYYLDTNQTVKGFGQIVAGSQRSDNYGLYNETFVQVPSSYGQMKCLFKFDGDSNYYARNDAFYAKDASGYLENIDMSEVSADDKLFTGISAKAIYDNPPISSMPGSYNVSAKDTLVLELDLQNLRKYYNDQTLTYDDLGIDEGYDFYHNDTYKFNAVLVYYSIYDSTNKNILATNAYGVLLLNSAQTNSEDTYIFPELIKSRSTSTSSGTSYSFRLNIKTSSVYSGDTAVTDNATAAYSMSTDFNDVVRNLTSAIDVMKSNANYLKTLASDNNSIRELAVSAVDEINNIRADVNLVKDGQFKNIDSSVIKGDDVSFGYIVPDVSFGYRDGNVYGNIHNDILNYKNIHTESLIVDSSAYIPVVKTDRTIVNGGNYLIGDQNNNIYARVSGSGIFSANTLYSYNNPASALSADIDASAAAELLSKIYIKFDSSNGIFTTILPDESQLTFEQARYILPALYTDSSLTGSMKRYINIPNMMNLYSTYFKYTQDSSVFLDEIYRRLDELDRKQTQPIPDSVINALN